MLRHTGASLRLGAPLPVDAGALLRNHEIEGASSPRQLVATHGEGAIEDLALQFHRRHAAFVRHGFSISGTTLSIGLLMNPAAVTQTIVVRMDLTAVLAERGAACKVVTHIIPD